MLIEKTFYKDRPAVCADAGRLKAVFLPEDGGKMASLQAGSRELLVQAPGKQYRRLTADGSYVNAECSGFDDLFPTIDPYTPAAGEYAGITYPDHGEICRSALSCKVKPDRAVFSMHSRLFNMDYEKIVSARSENALLLEYRIVNRGTEAFPFIWGAHFMLDGRGAVLQTPFGDDAEIRQMFGPTGSRTRLEGPCAENKFYYTHPVPEGRCGCRWADGTELWLEYPSEKLPWLAVWLNNGSLNGMYNVSLEPCSAPYDRPDAAQKASAAVYLAAGETFSFDLTLRLSHPC